MISSKEKILSFIRRFGPFLLIFTACLYVYVKTASFGFVYYDDNRLVLNQITSLAQTNVVDMFGCNVFFESTRLYYRPLLTVSLALNAVFSGANAAGYHWLNLALHIIATLLVYAVLLRLYAGKGIPLFLALVFGAHPLLVDAVAWIPGRNDSLLACFLLPAFLFFILHTERPARRWIWLHGVFFLAAMFTKETAAILPLLCLLYRRMIARKPLWDRETVVFIVMWVASVAVFFALRNGLIHGREMQWARYPLYILRDLPMVMAYLANTIIPVNIGLLPSLYDIPWTRAAAASVLAAAVYFFVAPDRRTRALFGIIWFFLFLIPTFAFFKAYYQGNRAYVPMLGMLIFAGEGIVAGMCFIRMKRLFLIAGALIIIGLSLAAFYRTENYFSAMRFWKTAQSEDPRSPVKTDVFGTVLWKVYGIPLAAIGEFQRAIELSPPSASPRINLAELFLLMSKGDKAVLLLEDALRISPNNSTAWLIWGDALAQSSDFRGALEKYVKALRYNRGDEITRRKVLDIGKIVRAAARRH